MLRVASVAAVFACVGILPFASANDPPEGDRRYDITTKDRWLSVAGPNAQASEVDCSLYPSSKKCGDSFDGYCFSVSYSYLLHYFVIGPGVRLDKNPWRASWMSYPPLERGELIPLVGRVYRVTRNDERHVFEWVPSSKLPEGLEVPFVESLFVTTERQGVGWITFKDGKLRCPKIVPGKGDKDPKDGPSAEFIYEDHLPKKKPGGKVELHTGTVRANDMVVLPNEGAFIVRRVVPPDVKNKILGWVELSSEALGEDAVVKTKLNVVRLQPSKK